MTCHVAFPKNLPCSLPAGAESEWHAEDKWSDHFGTFLLTTGPSGRLHIAEAAGCILAEKAAPAPGQAPEVAPTSTHAMRAVGSAAGPAWGDKYLMPDNKVARPADKPRLTLWFGNSGEFLCFAVPELLPGCIHA